MNGLDKITRKIIEDAELEAARIRAGSEAESDALQQKLQTQMETEREEILARGRRQATERLARLDSAARMEGKKLNLGARQDMIGEAFTLAVKTLCTLSQEDYIALLTRLVLEASTTGHEELIFSPSDRSRVGKQVVMAVNEALVKEIIPELPPSLKTSIAASLIEKIVSTATIHFSGVASLTLSQETRELEGGFILADGNVEVNCAFETLVRLQRECLEREVANILFPK